MFCGTTFESTNFSLLVDGLSDVQSIPALRSLQGFFFVGVLILCSAGQQFQNVSLHHRVVAETLEPFDIRLSPKPGELSFRVMSHIEFRLLDCAVQVALTPQILDYTSITVCAKSAGVCRHAAGEQRAHLFHQSISKVFLSALVDARV